MADSNDSFDSRFRLISGFDGERAEVEGESQQATEACRTGGRQSCAQWEKFDRIVLSQCGMLFLPVDELLG